MTANFVWKVELEEHWTYMEENEFDFDGSELRVVAKDAKEAEQKALDISIGKTFENDENPERVITEMVTAARLISLERMFELDA